MAKLKELKVQYLTDETGEKVGVLLPVQQFNELMEDIDDLAALAERREEPTMAHEDVLEQLKRWRRTHFRRRLIRIRIETCARPCVPVILSAAKDLGVEVCSCVRDPSLRSG